MANAPTYRSVMLFIDGAWSLAADGRTLPVINPANEEQIGTVAHAGIADLDRALAAAERGFALWRKTPAMARAKVLNGAARLLRERNEDIATQMVLEQGKMIGEARGEVERAAEACDWMAGETMRIAGRIIEGRAANITNHVLREPVGIVAAFTPWNFPVNQIVRKVAGALAAGCALVVKGPEEAPGSCAELVRAFVDAGAPAGVVNLVYGTPAEISEYLVPHPLVRKISFTGSTVVGKHLASLAGQHMKLTTMELGGHAPVLVFADADPVATARALVGNKFRNAGQSCVNPTRFLVEDSIFDAFTAAFVAAASALKPGGGLDPDTTTGPLANIRRVEAMERLTADALAKGAKLHCGGQRVGNKGFFFAPTVFTDVPVDAALMNEEPFGPIAMINRWSDRDALYAEANRLPYGLSAYAFTASNATANEVTQRVESAMISFNHFGLGHPETPFGGMKDSGYGFEGGSEAIEPYLQTRFITKMDL
ncbi:NAD-dependent succinate-semialdehyde dehydrogenase [Novosphingobium sediminicola]|uniref:Succinate-semialdehyde dehydrogenase/glutarate-semialdehyde dehydrogenase n=1 Tax=Novosphingobium sediminicola TaxID=563162 RepID=A0A7W6CLR0_9SPHN|nr:NAD-dependent succinate-semialdehyde dehydrogenase [Novosphingobium sediminicola]MBB3955281.1 succinate-semialdehyde dehydrogenase/glutarate-semialdehyde dehydrogenase [Novosphingobium sediminicola]